MKKTSQKYMSNSLLRVKHVNFDEDNSVQRDLNFKPDSKILIS